MKPVTRIAVLVPAALILVSGCATKSWVRETIDRKEAAIGQRVDQQFEQREAKITERFGTVEGRLTGEAQRVDGMTQRFGTLETSVGEASAAAAGAREAGATAMTKAEAVDKRLTRLWANRYSPRVVDTLDVYFGFDRSDLDDGAQTALLAIVKELQANPGLTVELVGFTDPKGAREYNYQLSQRRVDAVRRFLVEKGVGLARIQAVGLGPSTTGQTPPAQKRRVTAKLMLDQD
jgi:outer membrane protein OmpA-like peptidoglycan-associated protein